MTRRERKIVSDAIDAIMAEDGDFAGAINALCGLVGQTYPVATVKMVSASIHELIRGEPSLFSAGLDEKDKPNNEVFGIGHAAQLLGMSAAGLRYALNYGRIQDVELRGPSGARLFTMKDVDRLRTALGKRSPVVA